MIEWWNNLGLVLQIYYTIGIISTLIVLIQLLLMLIGFGGSETDGLDEIENIDTDADGIEDGDAGLGILSVRTVTAFFVGFGWMGVIAEQSGKSVTVSIIAAVITGTVFMFIVFALMRFLFKLKDSGTLDYRNAVGQIGTVYLPVPPKKTGNGQIEVLIQGRLAVVQALTDSETRLENRTKVRVVDIIDKQTLLVEPLN